MLSPGVEVAIDVLHGGQRAAADEGKTSNPWHTSPPNVYDWAKQELATYFSASASANAVAAFKSGARQSVIRSSQSNSPDARYPGPHGRFRSSDTTILTSNRSFSSMSASVPTVPHCALASQPATHPRKVTTAAKRAFPPGGLAPAVDAKTSEICDSRIMCERDEFVGWVQSVLRDAEIALHNGEPGPRRAIWSRHEPVSVLGAAQNAHGQDELDQLFLGLAKRFSDCTSYDFELLAAEVLGDAAYTAGLERITASVDGVPQTYVLRATQIYRREDGAWKVAHRHGSAPPK